MNGVSMNALAERGTCRTLPLVELFHDMQGHHRMSTKRNIVIDESMWSAIHKAIGRETSVTGERLTASGYIRRAVERDLQKNGVPVEKK